MSKYYVLYVSVPLSIREHKKIEADLKEILGEVDGSGTGCGFRDLDWSYDAMLPAVIAEKKVAEYFEKAGISFIRFDSLTQDGGPVDADKPKARVGIIDYDNTEEV